MTEPWLGLLTGRQWGAVRALVPAGRYSHSAAGALQLRLVHRGSSYLMLDLGAGRRRVYTRPGDLLLSLPHSATSFELDAPRHLIVVALAADRARALAIRAGGDGIDALAVLAAAPFRNPLAAELYRRLESPDRHTAAASDAVLAVLVAALLDQADNTRSRRRPTRLTGTALHTVLDHITEHLVGPLSVDELAALAGLPRRPFAAEFKLATGMPVHQYVIRRRVDRAVELLTGTEQPISDIAAQLGFSHQAHLTRLLRRLTGATPTQHRERARAPEGPSTDG